jgi:hypothetical protein
MQGCTKFIATLAGEILEGSVAQGCWKGCILWPLLLSLIVDELVRGLNENGCYTLRYADDIAILICGKIQNTISKLLQEVLGMTQQ